MSARATHLDLHRDLLSEPIAGSLAMAGADPVEFTGYTGLIAALEDVREAEALPTHGTGEPGAEVAPRALAVPKRGMERSLHSSPGATSPA